MSVGGVSASVVPETAVSAASAASPASSGGVAEASRRAAGARAGTERSSEVSQDRTIPNREEISERYSPVASAWTASWIAAPSPSATMR